jgi:hypothetical protein
MITHQISSLNELSLQQMLSFDYYFLMIQSNVPVKMGLYVVSFELKLIGNGM